MGSALTLTLPAARHALRSRRVSRATWIRVAVIAVAYVFALAGVATALLLPHDGLVVSHTRAIAPAPTTTAPR